MATVAVVLEAVSKCAVGNTISLNIDTTRWNYVQVGSYLSRGDLLRIAEWYMKLNGLTLIHQHLLQQAQMALDTDRVAGSAQRTARRRAPHHQGRGTERREAGADQQSLPPCIVQDCATRAHGPALARRDHRDTVEVEIVQGEAPLATPRPVRMAPDRAIPTHAP